MVQNIFKVTPSSPTFNIGLMIIRLTPLIGTKGVISYVKHNFNVFFFFQN